MARSNEDIRSLADTFIQALGALENSAERIDEIAPLFSDDACLRNAALDLGDQDYEGADGVRGFWQSYRDQFATITSSFNHVTVGDNCAGLFWNSSATLSSGDAMQYPGASLLVFNDEGKISEFYGYYDTRQFSSTRSAEEE